MLDASHVFSVTTASNLGNPTTRSNASSAYVQADPGGKGIQRLKVMYQAFQDEQEERNRNVGGPRKLVNQADLLLNNVFSNPVLRGTEIVTDPAFKAFIDRNQKLLPFNRRKEVAPESSNYDKNNFFVFEPTYQLD